MALSTTLNYDTAGNFTFDVALIEFAGPLAKLKDLRPVNATFAATYTNNINGVWGNGVLAGTAVGGASITNNRLDLAQNDGRHVFYDADLNADSQQVGAMKVKFTPDYSGNPANTQVFWDLTESDASVNNRIFVYHHTGGDIKVDILDSSGASIVAFSVAWVPVSGTTYEFELNFDITTGATRLFIDGVQLGSTATGTGTRDANISLLTIGNNSAGFFTGNKFFLEDLVIFDAVQHTANYTLGYTLPETKYSTANPKITVNAGQLADALSLFSVVVSEPSGSALRFHFLVDGQEKYWTGSAWADSDGTFAQSNTAADLNTNAATLDISLGVTLKLVAVLNSDGIAQPSVTSATFEFDFFITAVAIEECLIWGFVYDSLLPVKDAVVTVKTSKTYNFDENFISVNESAVTNSVGRFEITLPRTVLPDPDIKLDVKMVWIDSKSKKQTRVATIVVPNTATSSLEDAIVT